MTLDDDVRSELASLEAEHRLRTPRIIDGPQGPTVILDGVEVVNLSSNDYLSLAGDPRLARAAHGALAEAGSGAGASRLIAGTQRWHVVLEQAMADWMRCGGVRLFNTGYAANVGVMTTLVRAGDLVISDELNHASIIDGCRLSKAEVVVVPHRDLVALEQALARAPGHPRALVVTESLFSMDGDIADLGAIAALCRRFGAALVVDEAHAIGAIGPEGRGLCAEAAVVPDVVIGTFGKALGSFGAFAATTQPIAELLWNRARPFVFSTALPPSVPASSLAAIEIVRGSEGLDRRRTLASHARRFRELVPRAGGARESAIAPIRIGDDREVMRLTAQLLEARVFVQGIRPPTVPEGTARLRVSFATGHTVQQIDNAAVLLNNAPRHVV
ncbi:MAG: 8-amino-7-oxononanoate synthase [Deltaproteobacteria bacterium]|nr:8-amino-7-oxononanoate synthase [Deltaproteobacteria bacterium]